MYLFIVVWIDESLKTKTLSEASKHNDFFLNSLYKVVFQVKRTKMSD